MKKLLLLIGIAIIVVAVIAVLIVQKIQKSESPMEKSETAKITNEIEKKETPIQESAEEKTLGEVLGQGAEIPSVKYEMVTSQPGEPSMTQKVWFKKDKIRTEMTVEGQTAILIANLAEGTIYQYMPSQNMAIKMQSDTKVPEAPTESVKEIEKYKPTIVGTEKIDGKDCLVVEYNTEGTNIKSWIWKEKGFPLKMEMATTTGKTVIEYKNVEFVDIPDSMFELPAGVNIITP
jgi:outer membrane lipoprotein-sorting protein